MLADDQARFARVLQQGPAAYPQGLFAGPRDRALLGLKAHANTISHARLVALEETYPRLRHRLGHERFNLLSRAFVERAEVRARKLAALGENFAAFIESEGCDAQSGDLARIEWAWLESYHAAEAPALALADLAGLDEEGLLDLPLLVHPAVRIVALRAPLADELEELRGGGAAGGSLVLMARPGAEVRMQLLGHPRGEIFMALQNCGRMRNLLERAIEMLGEAEALPCIFALIEAGVLARPDS